LENEGELPVFWVSRILQGEKKGGRDFKGKKSTPGGAKRKGCKSVGLGGGKKLGGWEGPNIGGKGTLGDRGNTDLKGGKKA